MKFTKKQRNTIPLCYDKNNPKRIRHSWKKGEEIFNESGICEICGFDAFDNCHRECKCNKNVIQEVINEQNGK